MRRLFVKKGWFSGKLEKLAELFDIWWIKHFLVPILSVLPATLLIFYLRVNVNAENSGDSLVGLLPELQRLALEHPFVVVSAVGVYLILWNALIHFIGSFKKADEGVDVEGLLTLFEVLEKIVAAKAKRFGACAKDLYGEDHSGDVGDTFSTITQPEQQIALLANGLHAFFDAIDKDGVSFKVTIAVIAANGRKGGMPDYKPVDWLYFYPDSSPPRTTIEELQSPDSAISRCLAKKKIIIVESFEKEAAKGSDRQFVPRLADEDEEGSLICYPLIHHYTSDIPYVVTVVADKAGYFDSKKKKLYEWIFQHFAVRVCLEHSLVVIKRETQVDEAKS